MVTFGIFPIQPHMQHQPEDENDLKSLSVTYFALMQMLSYYNKL